MFTLMAKTSDAEEAAARWQAVQAKGPSTKVTAQGMTVTLNGPPNTGITAEPPPSHPDGVKFVVAASSGHQVSIRSDAWPHGTEFVIPEKAIVAFQPLGIDRLTFNTPVVSGQGTLKMSIPGGDGALTSGAG